jgi:hypothetical protein
MYDEYESFVHKVAESLYKDVINNVYPPDEVVDSIRILILYYEKIEDYEKCDVLKKIKQ